MNKNKKKLILQIANLLAPILVFILISLLSFLQADFGQSFTSEATESLIDPIGFAFAIWGPIFVFLAIFYFYQARDIFKSAENKIDMPYVHQVSVFFILSIIMPSLWYIFWAYQIIWLSTLFMILYLISLLIAYLRLNINLVERPRIEKIAIVVPWSMHTAWVTAATIISIKTFLMSINFNNPPFLFSDTYWAVIVLLVALGIYTTVLLTRNDYVYAAVGIWVLFGILIKRLTTSPLVIEVVIISIIGIIVLVIAIIYQVNRTKKAIKN
jgi:hypothetical protein